MDIRFQLSETEYLRGAREYCGRVRPNGWSSRLKLPLGLFLCVEGVAGLFLTRFEGFFHGFVLTLGLYFVLDALFFWPYRVRRLFRRSSNLHLEQHFAITEDTVEADTSVAKELLRWPAFQRAHEGDDAFFLLLSPVSFLLFPKRAFANGDLDVFRRLLQTKGLLK